jgi:hypothetical protein
MLYCVFFPFSCIVVATLAVAMPHAGAQPLAVAIQADATRKLP